jgi:hypothetical protein
VEKEEKRGRGCWNDFASAVWHLTPPIPVQLNLALSATGRCLFSCLIILLGAPSHPIMGSAGSRFSSASYLLLLPSEQK